MRERDDLRTLLMYEPRGHAAMSGAILQPPTRPDADAGVVFIEVSGCLPMCGHGTIGVATVLVETGMVEVTEPVTVDPAGHPGRAGRGLGGGRATAARRRSRSRTCPPSCSCGTRRVKVPGLGELTLDVAFGGNFFAILPAADVGLAVEPGRHDQIVATGLADHGRDHRAADDRPSGATRRSTTAAT